MLLLQRRAAGPEMTWFKVDDSFHSHPKVLATEPAALGLWVVAGTWSSANLTDGFVPDHVIPRLLPDAAMLAEALVTTGLWKRCRGGYLFHDWTDYNPSAKQVRSTREVRAAAGRKGGVASGKTRSKRASKPEANASVFASGLLEPPTRTFKPPPPPPATKPLWPAAVADETRGEGDQDRNGKPPDPAAALAAEVRAIRPDWSTASVLRALRHPDVAERPWPLVRSAALAVARDPQSQQPGRLAHDGPWWAQAKPPPRSAPKPVWCGKCSDDNKRQVELDDGRLARCPACHPLKEAI